MPLRLFLRLLGCAALLAAPLAAARNAEPIAEEFVGVAGCSSSSCHGGAGPQRNQVITWKRDDFHARAFAILTNARSARMAEALGGPAAPENARCTVCHSPFQAVAAARLQPSARPDEGVSCESCHGAAEGWLRGHTRPDWNRAIALGAGLRDLADLYGRANACVACHQNIDADLVAAGHPHLLFELDRQGAAQPPHWTDPPENRGARAWLVGQSVALRELSWKLALAPQPDPQVHAQWDGLRWLFGLIHAAAPALGPFDANSPYASMQTQADAMARRIAAGALPPQTVPLLRQTLAAAALEQNANEPGGPALFERAQRLLFALDRLTLAAEGARTPDLEKALSALRDTLVSRDRFDPRQFNEALRSFRAALPSS